MNFPYPGSENMGGALFFYFLDVLHLNSINYSKIGSVLSISITGSNLLFSGYSSPGTLSFDADPEPGQHGTTYNIVAKGFYPNPSEELQAQLLKMTKQQFIVLIKDASGQAHLLGTKVQPLRFSYKTGTATRANETPGASFQFYGKGYTPPKKYIPGIEAPDL